MINLILVFTEAINHRGTVNVKTQYEDFSILHGVRISKDNITGTIKIYNTTIGGDHYKELSSEEYLYFEKYGWELGVCHIRLANYRRKIFKVNSNIQSMMNKKKFSDKKYHEYKRSREKYMGLYADTLHKLYKQIK